MKTEYTAAGPVFEPAPGWGGKIKNWLSKNFSRRVLPATAVVILLWGISTFLSRPADKKTSKELMSSILVQVEKGDGAIFLARKALTQYLYGFPDIVLKPEQKIYIDNFFKEKLSEQKFVVDQKAEFLRKDLEQAVSEALRLPESKLEKLRAYLR